MLRSQGDPGPSPVRMPPAAGTTAVRPVWYCMNIAMVPSRLAHADPLTGRVENLKPIKLATTGQSNGVMSFLRSPRSDA
jgi:hypothetical protein